MTARIPSVRSAVPWIAFFCSLIAYWLTVEPGASLWDCPEYIDGALRLEIGHPPGNPTWILFHRIISLFGASTSGAVLAVNLASGFFTAWAVGLLCACSRDTLEILLLPLTGKSVTGTVISICALFGSLCFGWADSPWFSAVEAEVYAMSLWMTAICVWLTMKWLAEPDGGRRWQYLILTSYILGLSIGVHQLTMLVIPALAMIVAYGLVGPDRGARGRQWVAAVIGALIVAVVLFGLMKAVPRLLAHIELMAVNSLALPYNAGTIGGWLLILVLFGLSAFILSLRRRRTMSGIFWCLFFVCTGFSSYALIIVRASAAPPMNQGDPSDIFSFITYIDRDQYGGAPLIYGSTPKSRPLKREHISVNESGDTTRSYYGYIRLKERPYYSKAIPGARTGNSADMIPAESLRGNDSLARLGRDAYLLTGYKSRLKMIPELERWFPRLHSSNPADVAAYGDWTGMTDETMERVAITEAADSLGNPIPMKGPDGKAIANTELRPTIFQNISMLLGYQSGYMYFRYLLWNFGGRQNDVHSGGEVEHGNFITGFTPVDNLMLGAEDMLPDEVGEDNPGRNRYWMIPFILGIFGLTWLCCSGRRGRRIAGVSAVLFLMTGLAIVLYLNQTPGEPRERDYSFLGSFWVFGFWIAAGITATVLFVAKRCGRKKLAAAVTLSLLGVVPVWMLAENFDDHDRSGRYPAEDYSGIILSSLPENTILFTTGDNHTFPLWYARNSQSVRRDVTIVNTNYLQLPWQALQLMMRDENGRRVPMTMKREEIAYGAFSVVRVGRDTTIMDAVDALRKLYADTSAVPTLPAYRLRIGDTGPVIFDITENYGIRPGGTMSFRQLALLDIIATNSASRTPRPIAFHRSLSPRNFEGWSGFTSPLPFAVIWDPDSVFDPTPVYNAILAFEPKGEPGGRYIDPVYGGLISWQRMALMTEARRILSAGDTATARRILDFITRCYPFSEWRPILKGFGGETIDEAQLYVDLAESIGPRTPLTDSLSRHSANNRQQWARYRQSLPPRLRRAMTPASRRLSSPKRD